jgi:hypothetical protein
MAEPAASKDAEVGTSTRASTWETSSTRTSWVTLRDFLAALWNFLAVVGDRGLGGATEICSCIPGEEAARENFGEVPEVTGAGGEFLI